MQFYVVYFHQTPPAQWGYGRAIITAPRLSTPEDIQAVVDELERPGEVKNVVLIN